MPDFVQSVTERGNHGFYHHEKPKNHMVGEGTPFERTRRITGYLVGALTRFNNAKRAEERDRVKHGVA